MVKWSVLKLFFFLLFSIFKKINKVFSSGQGLTHTALREHLCSRTGLKEEESSGARGAVNPGHANKHNSTDENESWPRSRQGGTAPQSWKLKKKRSLQSDKDEEPHKHLWRFPSVIRPQSNEAALFLLDGRVRLVWPCFIEPTYSVVATLAKAEEGYCCLQTVSLKVSLWADIVDNPR